MGAGTLQVAARSLGFKLSPFHCWGDRRVGEEGEGGGIRPAC